MYIVTGGAGFVGSHIVRALNERGSDDILVVDDMTQGEKFRNLADCTVADYMDIDEFANLLEEDKGIGGLQGVLHQGACADTMEENGQFMLERNFTFSKMLLHWAMKRECPFVYASSAAVYGAGRESAITPENENPINVYAYSKLLFDQYVRRLLPHTRTTVAGLRYFNVYGPREWHKGRMASMVTQLYGQLRDTGVAKLFGGTDGFGDGEQRRDFVFVKDVARVNFFFLDGEPKQGIFNVGTGMARSFNDVANVLGSHFDDYRIEYIPFPEKLKGKYQSFTEADISTLREAGFREDFTSLEDGIARSVSEW